MTEFDIIFFNNGDIQIQSKNWVISGIGPLEAVDTISECLDGEHEYGVYFDENDEQPMVYDYEEEARGDYKWIGSATVMERVVSEHHEEKPGGFAEKEFFAKLFEKRNPLSPQQ